MKVIWALDPFQSRKSDLKKLAGLLKALTLEAGDQVLPTFVSGPESRLWPGASSKPIQIKTKLASTLDALDFTRFRSKGVVLKETEVSLRAAAERMNDFAIEQNADFIALNTRARKGLSSLLLGSFAEILLHSSPISLISVTPQARVHSKISTLFFATDLSHASQRAFRRVLELADRLGAGLLIFHAPDPTYNIRHHDKDAEVRAYRHSVDSKLLAMDRAARKVGVLTETIVDCSWRDVAELIEDQAARSHADAIVLAARAAPRSARFLGSVTRRLLRESNKPIIIIKA